MTLEERRAKLEATCNTDDRLGALLAHFGLAPEPEAPQ